MMVGPPWRFLDRRKATMRSNTALPPTSTDAAASATTAPDKRAANHPDYQAWEARMSSGAERLAKNEDERREAGKHLY